MEATLTLDDLMLESANIVEAFARASALEKKGERVPLGMQLLSIQARLEGLAIQVCALHAEL